MITRYWRGFTYADEADAYLAHLEEDTIETLKQIEGFQNAYVLRNDGKEGVEFVVLTMWESLDAIKKFAGDALNRAVVPDKARKMMIAFDEDVTHYEVALHT